MTTGKDELNVRFGMLLALQRKAHGFATQEAFASKVGVSESTIAQIEAGSYDPSFDMIKKLAGALSIDPAAFFYSDFKEQDAKSKIIFEINLMLKKAGEKTLLRVRDAIKALLK